VSRPEPFRRAGWFVPPVLLLAVLLGAGIARRGPFSLFGLVLLALALVPALWVLVSALWPARAERRCPACGRDGLARASPRSTVGLVCRACGWRDDEASSWTLAEEEGPLEDVVLEQRGRRQHSGRAPVRPGPERPGRPGGAAGVDSPARAD
jgi:hypothetical protein